MHFISFAGMLVLCVVGAFAFYWVGRDPYAEVLEYEYLPLLVEFSYRPIETLRFEMAEKKAKPILKSDFKHSLSLLEEERLVEIHNNQIILTRLGFDKALELFPPPQFCSHCREHVEIFDRTITPADYFNAMVGLTTLYVSPTVCPICQAEELALVGKLQIQHA